MLLHLRARFFVAALFLVTLVCAPSPSSAREPWLTRPPPQPKPGLHVAPDSGELYLDLPLLDVPFNFEHGYQAPSMQQSLAVTKDLALGVHAGIDWVAGRFEPQTGFGIFLQRFLEMLAIGTFDAVSLFIPGGPGWEHEEWHRAVMSHRGVSSFDEIYLLGFGQTTSVSRETDLALSQMKAEHPQDFIRLPAAGIEAQSELVLSIEREIFLTDRAPLRDLPFVFINLVNNTAYLYQCAARDGTQLTNELRDAEGTDVSRRDFTGLDCLGWVYDLHRPFEPYEARGMHPSGVGVNRYRTLDDLTPKEQSLLRRAANLSLLAFIAPQLVGIAQLPVPFSDGAAIWNFALQHELTSFGQALSLNVFARTAQRRFFFSAHAYLTDNLTLPGLEADWVSEPFHVGDVHLLGTAGALVWLQPKDGLFDATEFSPGVDLRLGVALPFARHWSTFLELEAKTPGWVAGNVELGRGITARAGLSLTL